MHSYSLFLPLSQQSPGVLAAVEQISTATVLSKEDLAAARMILVEAGEEKVGRGNVSNKHLLEAASILLGEMGCSRDEYRLLRMRLSIVKKPGGGNTGGQKQRSR